MDTIDQISLINLLISNKYLKYIGANEPHSEWQEWPTSTIWPLPEEHIVFSMDVLKLHLMSDISEVSCTTSRLGKDLKKIIITVIPESEK